MKRSNPTLKTTAFSYALCLLALYLITGTCIQGVFAQETKGQLVKVEYLSDKDVTRITLNPFILVSRKHEELRLGAVAEYPGKTKALPREVALVFLSISATDMSKYESAHNLTVTADGQRLRLGETRVSKQEQNGLFVESMMIAVPMEEFLRICRSKQVTMKLGFTEVELSTPQMEILRLAASYMTE
jgi:hypothetical protein